ncbi:MAG TPA: hypothetical protein VL251_10730 [Thermomonas sp.]|nr:hypothetical protein [Thermomonas sp.]
MAMDDDVFGPMHAALFATFGVDATVQRGAADPVPVRIIVNRGQERLGEYGQVVAHVTTLDMQVSEWVPEHGDEFTWTDRLGAQTHKVDKPLENDGFVAKAVLYG